MIPELGRYATEVLSAYVVSLALLGGIVAWYWLRARAARSQLDQVEQRQERNE
ncbi:heme exporter protein CcmD [Rhodobacteraceae bacterium 2376]|uniref:Heme exporter protein D n=1 Tax=Rhabdonatronobacter sediminivivens TaxID=2743469 RepID=A0A7Z0HWM1_9RHOB|nr:heme exporter protein CcmD [Rhabdonatronobacter sediminivivens]NYS23685.1 heme exporter protein CcmD [Rhabdonatronobacter sediminivivens]